MDTILWFFVLTSALTIFVNLVYLGGAEQKPIGPVYLGIGILARAGVIVWVLSYAGVL